MLIVSGMAMLSSTSCPPSSLHSTMHDNAGNLLRMTSHFIFHTAAAELRMHHQAQQSQMARQQAKQAARAVSWQRSLLKKALHSLAARLGTKGEQHVVCMPVVLQHIAQQHAVSLAVCSCICWP